MSKTFLLLAAALLMPALPVEAAPAAITVAVAAKDRPADEAKLDESRKPAEVLKFLGLERGDRAFDFMAGRGYYSEIMARAVGPKGMVVAWNPSGIGESDPVKTAWQSLRVRVKNVAVFSTFMPDLALAPASFDFALFHLVYHDAYWESAEYKLVRTDPALLLATLYGAMKSGGIVGVIDHVGPAGGDTRAEVDKTHRIDPAVVRADFERAGFVFEGESDVLRVPGDDLSKSVFDPAVRGKTDRIVYKFSKPDGAPKDDLAMACDVEKAQSFIGRPADEATVGEMKKATGARTARVVPPNGAVTMDFRPDRLTISTDEAGNITRVSCG
ncbi:I78 family peptidase inhibitor [Sphingosinicella soli]|uniref:Putative methyltransferase n=1 Tax=Sphingosinicella soli TaxID=333708 RepID=A0A7W7F5C1_9SPHN|nr:I78 family peptidase inhibitor [Sphingosinicella soli]MBB4631250.1 putative methyltransferase [Sphingosinicella soli]